MANLSALNNRRPPSRAMKKKEIEALFVRFQKQRPDPQTELNFHSAFELLIAVILSAQATDKSVNKITADLFAIADTPQSMLALGEKRLRQMIRTIGLYNAKAKHIIACCKILLTDHQGQVPRTQQALEALPGVGRKTANVVLNVAFGQPTIAVDTHVFRVSNRTGLATGQTVNEVEKQLLLKVPERFLLHAHHWLLLHGRWICQARRPLCGKCYIRDLCHYPAKSKAPAL